MTSGSVTMAGVFLLCGDAMEMEIVWMDQMKWTALVGFPPPPPYPVEKKKLITLHITVLSIFVFL